MTHLSLDIADDGIAIATFDMAGRSMNVISAEVQAELSDMVRRAEADDAIRGVILRSAKPGCFCAGADLIELERDLAGWRDAGSQDELRTGLESAGRYGAVLRAIELSPKPFAAAIQDLALGGGLELALACHVRVAAATPKLRLALPETSIGLMPGAGATQRLPRLMGIAAALPHLIDGDPIDPSAAVDRHVLHALVEPKDLIEECRRRLKDAYGAPWDAKGFKLPGGGPHGGAALAALSLRTARLAGAHGAAYAGHANTLRAIYEGSQVPIDAGLRIETRYFFNTARHPSTQAMVATLFHARQAHGRRDAPDEARTLLAALRDAWAKAATGLVAEGVPPTVVGGIARSLGWPAGPEAVDDRPRHQPDRALVDRVSDRLLSAGAEAANGWIADHPATPCEWVNHVAVSEGYPAWTGGPLARRERGEPALPH